MMMKINLGTDKVISSKGNKRTKEIFQEAEEENISCKICLLEIKRKFQVNRDMT